LFVDSRGVGIRFVGRCVGELRKFGRHRIVGELQRGRRLDDFERRRQYERQLVGKLGQRRHGKR
jgi:hypothetical protein